MSGIGSAVGDFFGAIGDFQEAAGYGQAARYADKQAQLVKLSTGIQQTQTERQAYQVIGAQETQVGAASFSESGSAQDLLRSSTQQSTLQKSLVTTQGLITQTGYEAQAAADRAMASAATMAGIGNAVGGVLSLFGL